MTKLWTFGDSITESLNSKFDWVVDYIKWKGYKPKVYSEVLSEELNMKLNNFGIAGSDNYTIFETFCSVVDKIKSNDLVVFGWSSPIRFRLVNNDNWKTLLPNCQQTIDGVDLELINQILVNRNHNRYCDEVNNWIKLINRTLKNNVVIHWTPFDKRINAEFVEGLERIYQETDGDVVDNHFSENGHIGIAEIIKNIYYKKHYKAII